MRLKNELLEIGKKIIEMSEKTEKLLIKYKSELEINTSEIVDIELLTRIAKSIGPAIYNPDSSLVSPSSKTEIRSLKNNFLIKKLGLKNSPELDDAIKYVVNRLENNDRKKYKVVVFYLLTKYFRKEDVFINKGTGPR